MKLPVIQSLPTGRVKKDQLLFYSQKKEKNKSIAFSSHLSSQM